MATQQKQRLSPADSKRLIDDYTLYRFGHVLSPSEFATQAGVDSSAIGNLLAQKPIAEDDLRKIARSIDISIPLLSEIAGYQEMSADTRASLDRFFAALGQSRTQKKQSRAA